MITAAVNRSQADLLTADSTSVGAENMCSEQITLGQPLICMSTALTAEVCIWCNDDTASAEAACTSSKVFLKTFLQVVTCACYSCYCFGYLLSQHAMQTNYAAGVASLKAAAKDVAIRYQHYSSGVVRLEVSLKHFTSIDSTS